MNYKSSVSKSNSPKKGCGDDVCMKSSDIKLEPKAEDNFSNQQHNDNKQDFLMVQFVKTSCIKVEETVEEDIGTDLGQENIHYVSRIEKKVDKSYVVNCDGKNQSLSDSDIEMQENVRLCNLNTNIERADESDDNIIDNVHNSNQYEG